VSSLLEVDDVHVHYGKVAALKGVTLTVAEGEIVALIGANGAGKTTTLKTISGVRPVTSGSVRFEGRDLAGVPARGDPSAGVVSIWWPTRRTPSWPAWYESTRAGSRVAGRSAWLTRRESG
jgi:ABC-type branched-subunit amino acid transport system ATPase component